MGKGIPAGEKKNSVVLRHATEPWGNRRALLGVCYFSLRRSLGRGNTAHGGEWRRIEKLIVARRTRLNLGKARGNQIKKPCRRERSAGRPGTASKKQRGSQKKAKGAQRESRFLRERPLLSEEKYGHGRNKLWCGKKQFTPLQKARDEELRSVHGETRTRKRDTRHDH